MNQVNYRNDLSHDDSTINILPRIIIIIIIIIIRPISGGDRGRRLSSERFEAVSIGL